MIYPQSWCGTMITTAGHTMEPSLILVALFSDWLSRAHIHRLASHSCRFRPSPRSRVGPTMNGGGSVGPKTPTRASSSCHPLRWFCTSPILYEVVLETLFTSRWRPFRLCLKINCVLGILLISHCVAERSVACTIFIYLYQVFTFTQTKGYLS